MKLRNDSDKLRIAAQQNVKERQYWLKKMSGYPGKSSFTYDNSEEGSEANRDDSITFIFSKNMNERLAALSRGSDEALHLVLLTALVLLLEKYTGNNDITVAIPVYSDPNSQGEFINTVLPIRTQIENNTTFKELLFKVRETVIEANEHLNYPIEVLAEQLNLSFSTGDFPLFDIALLVRNIHDKKYLRHIHFKMIFSFRRTDEIIEGEVEYRTSCYKKTRVEQVIKHFILLVEKAVTNPEEKLANLSILSDEEKKQVLVDFNDTGTAYAGDKTLIQWISGQIKKTPDHIAAVETAPNERGPSGPCVITYRELDKKSDQLFSRLQGKGIQADTIVGIMGERSIGMIVGMLGILKTGGAYLPIDPGYPRDWIETVIKDSGLEILLTRQNLDNPLEFPGDFIYLDLPKSEELEWGGTDSQKPGRPGDLAYIIYTSGSTGKPKGVMIEHANVSPILHWFAETYNIKTGYHVLQAANVCFDVSVEEIFVSLIFGAVLFIPGKETLLSPMESISYFEKHDINILQFVPVMLEHILAESKRINCLDVVICGGDKLEEFLKNLIITKGYNLYNHYGPTEVTVDAAVSHCDSSPVTIGKPISCATVYIVDKNNQLLPVGIPGELCIGGTGLARGYLNQPELTSGKFTMFNPGYPPDAPPIRIYRSGDRGRWLPGGNIEFLGRLDHQVKIRGYRIELQEIQSVLKSNPLVDDAVVFLEEVTNADELSTIPLDEADQFINQIKKNHPSKIKQFLDENNYELTLEIKNDNFINTPQAHQRNWILQRIINEYKDDLLHLDKQTRHFIKGTQRKEITADWKTDKALYDDSRLTIAGQQVMQDWEVPLMKKMAQIAAESRGDVLEVGFGMGIAATYLLEMGVKSYTVIECNDDVVKHFQEWRRKYPHANIRLLHGKWQEVRDQLDTYDAIFFDTYPLDEEEFLDYVVNHITFAEHFFPTAAKHLREGGVFTYYTNEIDSFSRRHQRLVFDYFDILSLEIVKPLTPPADCEYWWADSMAAVKAIKLHSQPGSKKLPPPVKNEKSPPGRNDNYRITLEINNDNFINPPQAHQRNWILQRLKDEMESDLLHLDKQTRHFIKGSQRKEITGDWKTGKALYNGPRLTIAGQQVMQDWERPLMKRMAQIAAESHGDVLEVGFGMGISATYLLEMGVKSYTVIECNDDVVKHFQEWRRKYPHANIRLLHGKWQEVRDQLNTYDAIFFDTYPLNEEEYLQYVINNITFAEHFFPTAAAHLREGGVFTYYTNEIDSFSRRHQRLAFKYFHVLSLEVVKSLEPPPDCDYWWADSMVAIKAVKLHWEPPGAPVFKEIDLETGIKGLSPRLRQALAQRLGLPALKKDTEKKLVAYLVMKKGQELNVEDIRQYLQIKLPDYMIPVYFLKIDRIPLNSNGKIDKKALPMPGSQHGSRGAMYKAPRNTIEKKLVEIWTEVLNYKEDTNLGIDDNFFHLGGHSLSAVVMSAKVHKALNVKLPLAAIFEKHTIRALAEYIKDAAAEAYVTIEPVEKKEYFPLSSAQKGMYFLQQKDPGSTAYNMSNLLTLPAIADIKKLEQTFIKLINRHENLRTSFHLVNNQPVQETHHHIEFRIEYYDLAADADLHHSTGVKEKGIHQEPGPTSRELRVESHINRFIRPFSLDRAPILRVGLIRTTREEHLLLVDTHHIISDGVSHWILEKDFKALYEDNPLPHLRLQYKDYSQWQNRQLLSGELKKQQDYWLERLNGYLPNLNLSLDYPRSENPGTEGMVEAVINKEITLKVKQIVAESGGTLFIFLLAALNIMLSKYSNQEDIVIGCPTAGRTNQDLNNIIGMFVNMVAIRNFPKPGKTFREFLEEVKHNSLKALENQDYPFEDLVRKLGIPRHHNRNPLIDIVFVTDQEPGRPVEITTPGKTTKTGNTRAAGIGKVAVLAKFDIVLGALETDNGIYLSFNYQSNLFKHETLERKSRHLLNIVQNVAANPGIKISQIKMLDDWEKEELKSSMIDQPDKNSKSTTPPTGKIKMEAGFDF